MNSNLSNFEQNLSIKISYPEKSVQIWISFHVSTFEASPQAKCFALKYHFRKNRRDEILGKCQVEGERK